MRKPRSIAQCLDIDLYPQTRICPACGSQLKHRYRKRRLIVRLTAQLQVTSHFLECASPDCPQRNLVYRPEQEDLLALRGYTFGLDVVALIGELRYQNKRSITQIHQQLASDGVAISIKEVALLSEVFLALVTTAVAEDKAIVEQLKSLGGIVLSIDGVQPEKGNDTLYLLREIQSGRVLLARNLRSSSATEIEKLIEEVKALGVPILGVVSDKQESLCLAIERALPGVPHQLCHFHYLRDMAQPVSDADRQLKKNLRIKVRGIKAIEDSIENRQPDTETRIAGRFCEAVRTVMRDDGKYPLDPAGLKLYSKLSEIEQSVQRAVEARGSRLLRRVIRLLSVLEVYVEEFERIYRVYEWIHRIAQMLEVEAGKELTSRLARRKLMRYIERLDAKGDESIQEYIDHIKKQSRAFESRLFTYVDQPLLPRTNNDLEQFIGRMKKARRQVTGRKNTQEYILREGQYVAILYGLPEVNSYIARFAEVDFGAFRETLERMRRKQQRSNAWRVRRDLAGYLKDLEQVWTSSE